MRYAVLHDLYLNAMAEHFPVLHREVLAFFSPQKGQKFMDCTFGGGGHTRAMLEAAEGVRVWGLDCDPEAGPRASEVKADFQGTFTFCDFNFSRLAEVPETWFDGILFDLGVSSFQLDTPERGFSFRFNGPNDMRLNPREGWSAAEFLERATLPDLIRAVRDYGEEPRWKNVVKAIVEARGTGILADTASFAELVARAAPPPPGPPARIHPATLTFQGVRMAVNRELEVLEAALPAAFSKLGPGGLLAVISFHSLEDRVCKRFFRRLAGLPETSDDDTPKDFRKSWAELVTKKPVRPAAEELLLNPRSRSAKLRVIRKF